MAGQAFRRLRSQRQAIHMGLLPQLRHSNLTTPFLCTRHCRPTLTDSPDPPYSMSSHKRKRLADVDSATKDGRVSPALVFPPATAWQSFGGQVLRLNFTPTLAPAILKIIPRHKSTMTYALICLCRVIFSGSKAQMEADF